MSDFYNAFGKFVSMSTIEGFAVDIKKDDEILKEIDQLKLKIESGKITKEQIITEIEKLNSLKENKDTSVAVKNAIELLVKNSISKIDGIKFTGNMELSGVMKSKGYYLSDGTKVNEVTRVINKFAVPLDKDGHLNIQPPLGKKVKATVNELNIPKNGRITFGDKEDNDPYHLRKIGNTDNNHLRLTLNDNNNESLQIWGDSCKTDKCAADGGTVKHVFDTNGNASHTGGMKVTGGRSHFKDAENKGRVRVGAAWGIPGFYSEDNQDIVVGVPGNRKVNLGTAGKFVEITGNGNMKVPSDINTPVLSRIGGDWLRINQQGNSAGKVAAYGGFSINDTRSRSGGLSVGSWAPPGQGNIKATGSIGASGINIINGKNNRGNPDGAPTHFNYNGKGENYIRGYTIHQGELRILNPKNENNMGWGTHFNHEGKGRNYIRGKTEMRGDVNFIGNIKTDGKICINNTCITESQLKTIINSSNSRSSDSAALGVANRAYTLATELGKTVIDVQNGYRKIPGMYMAAYGNVNKGGDYITYGGYCLVLEKNGSLRLYKGSSPYDNNKQLKWQYDSGKAPGEATLSWDENRNGGNFLIKLNGSIIWDAPKRNGKTLYTDKRRRSLILQGGVVSFRDGSNSYIWTAGEGDGPQGKFA